MKRSSAVTGTRAMLCSARMRAESCAVSFSGRASTLPVQVGFLLGQVGESILGSPPTAKGYLPDYHLHVNEQVQLSSPTSQL